MVSRTSDGASARSALAAIAIGLVIAGVVLFVQMRAGARTKTVLPATQVVSDDVGALREVLVHYVPELESTFEPSYRDFLTTLPNETNVVVVLPRGRRPALDAFLARIDPERRLAPRMRAIEVGAALGIWSKDRALVLSSGGDDASSERITLLVPPRPRLGESSRPSDWDIVPAVAAATPERIEVRQLPISFDAGDFAIAGKRVVFDINLFTRNRSRGFPSAIALRERVRALVGRDVVMLGAADGDVPRHHMSMYMAPLGPLHDAETPMAERETVLVGDPSAGARIVGADFAPGESSPETDAHLRADFSARMQARFDRAAAELTASGFRVVRIPTVPFDDQTYFAYTNGIYETRGGRRTAWVPRFDVPALDAAAHEVYASLGFEVIPVGVRSVYTQHGTIGCLVNVLSRTK